MSVFIAIRFKSSLSILPSLFFSLGSWFVWGWIDWRLLEFQVSEARWGQNSRQRVGSWRGGDRSSHCSLGVGGLLDVKCESLAGLCSQIPLSWTLLSLPPSPTSVFSTCVTEWIKHVLNVSVPASCVRNYYYYLAPPPLGSAVFTAMIPSSIRGKASASLMFWFVSSGFFLGSSV